MSQVEITLSKKDTVAGKPVYGSEVIDSSANGTKAIEVLSTNSINGHPIVRVEIDEQHIPTELSFLVNGARYIAKSVEATSNGIIEFTLEPSVDGNSVDFKSVLLKSRKHDLTSEGEIEATTQAGDKEVSTGAVPDFFQPRCIEIRPGSEILRSALTVPFEIMPDSVIIKTALRNKTNIPTSDSIFSSSETFDTKNLGKQEFLVFTSLWSTRRVTFGNNVEFVITVVNGDTKETKEKVVDARMLMNNTLTFKKGSEETKNESVS